MKGGQHLGSYELVARIGEGGMGEVWEGTHRHLDRPAAIKLIRAERLGQPGAEGEQLRRRFLREAKATSALTSPHTVQLYDFGITDDGTFFYVMELLEGCSLEELVRRDGPVPSERAVAIARQVCTSLVEAHHHGVVHRDIKPANIYLSKVGMTCDFAKLLDFGLVKFDSGSSLASAKLTGDDVAQGTPAYMPPEVVRGSAHFDARADLYALGCVLYWLLTGHTVFEAATALEVVLAHVNEPPLPPSARSDLPIGAELEAVVMRCLAKDPADRPQSAAELSEALAACPLERPWTQERAAAWWEQRRPATWARGVAASTPALSTMAERPAPVPSAAPRALAVPLLGAALLVAAVVGGVFLGATWSPEVEAPSAPEPAAEAPAPPPPRPVEVVPAEVAPVQAAAPAPPAPTPVARVQVTVTSRPYSKVRVDGRATSGSRWRGELRPGPHEVTFEGHPTSVTMQVPAEGPFVFCWNLELGTECPR